MASFLDYISRWMLALLLVFKVVQQSESFTWTRRPAHKLTVVVKGVNSSRVSLIWDFSASSNYLVSLSRQRPGEVRSTQIASRYASTAFWYTNETFRSKYELRPPANLVLKDVKQNDEYVYTITVENSTGVYVLLDQVTIDVVVPPKLTIVPVREPQLSIGQNYTLTCNASGDPHPIITWTKDGVPANQFNVCGYLLHLVNVQRKDAGSYRCTASNGYGDDATSVSIVNIKFSPSITVTPVRMADIEVGNDLTLTCYASGYPKPTIIWTKDSVSVKEAIASGHFFHLVNAHRKDAGSYRCTASNGYGKNVTSVSIISIKCGNICKTERVGITLTETKWNHSLSNRESTVFKTLESAVLMAIWNVYGQNSGKELYKVSVEEFRPGSIVAIVKLLLGKTAKDPLKPLLDEITDGRLGSFRVSSTLDVDPSDLPLQTTNFTRNEAEGKFVFDNEKERCITNDSWTKEIKLHAIYSSVIGFLVIINVMTIMLYRRHNNQASAMPPKAFCSRKRKGSSQQAIGNSKRATRSSRTAASTTNQDQSLPLEAPGSGVLERSPNQVQSGAVSVDVGALTATITAAISQGLRDSGIVPQLPAPSTQSVDQPASDAVVQATDELTMMPVGSSNTTSCRYNGKNENDIQDQGAPLQLIEAYVNLADGLMLSDEESTVAQSPPLGSTLLNKTHQTASEFLSPNPETKLKNWKVSREHVEISKVIGRGAFCQVAKATFMDINGVKGKETVAVKVLKVNAPKTDKKDLLSELELLKILKPHPHVIKLIGCVTESEPLLVLIEYIPYGDLLGYLRKSRGLNDTYFNDPDVKPQTNLTSQQLIKFAWQIADGMSYLCSNKIIHRDLAARNVLVGEGEKCKVTDFGMARNVYQDDIYTKESRGRLPVKWTAYEGLLYGIYTTQSDVWSFGVVLYEIFTVGGSPYPGINGREIPNKLQKGYRMPKPKHVDDQLYQIMLQCWQENPNDRPTFSKLKDTITRMAQSNNETYVNMKEYDTNLYANVDDLSMD
ncbi:hypothetical protein ACROYT_G028405 [Oculina patagonica]